MDKFKAKVNAVKKEADEAKAKNQILLNILSQCSCGARNSYANLNLDNEIRENVLKSEQL
jgi:hypothetical protein